MTLGKEQAEHINIVNWFNYQYPELANDFHHFANERRCSVQQGRLLKRMGVKKGVADFFLAVPTLQSHPDGPRYFGGLWLELKVGNGKLSPEQKAFIDRKISMGYMAMGVWGFEAATEIIRSYLKYYKPNRVN